MTPAQIKKYIALARKGMTLDEIADELDLTPHQLSYRLNSSRQSGVNIPKHVDLKRSRLGKDVKALNKEIEKLL